MSAKRTWALVLGALLLAAPRPAAAAPPMPRTFAVVPFYGPERLWTFYAPFVEHLSRATGTPWKLVLPATHDAVIEELCSGRVDVALLGPIPMARANKRCGALPFLVPLSGEGTTDYHAVLVTNDPEVTSVAALRGREIGIFKGSTAAHVLPVQMLEEVGLPQGSYTPVFVEGQDKLIAALLGRKIAATGLKLALFKRLEKEPGIRQLRVSGPLPNFALAARPSLPAATRDRLVAALKALRPKERAADAQAVKGWDDEVRNGFVDPPPGFLGSVQGLQALTERILKNGK